MTQPSEASDNVVPHRLKSHESAQLRVPPHVLSALKSTDFEAQYACVASEEYLDTSAECPSQCVASKQTHIDAV
jgi:hypothetical protein